MKSSVAQFACIRFPPFVVSHVLLEIVRYCLEAHRTFLNDIAFGQQSLLAIMRFDVHIQIDFATERLIAHFAFELLVGCVDF